MKALNYFVHGSKIICKVIHINRLIGFSGIKERVLNVNGASLIQMPNFLGIRSLQHQVKRGFREANSFEVRYWSVPELKRVFRKSIGNTLVSVDCYFGLGLQKNDMKYMSLKMKIIIGASEILRKISTFLPPMKYLADSVYVRSRKI